MFDHVNIHVSDLAASTAFYREALGLPTTEGEFVEWGDFGLEGVSDDHPLTRKLHIAFGSDNRDEVDAWWNRMTEAGYESDGEPGPRPQYSESYYGAFVLDPDGNSVESVHHATSRAREIDHLWLRTLDVAATKRFYETVAPIVGITLRHDKPGHIHMPFDDGRGSFSFVEGEPTENVHLAFGVPGYDAVVRFHEAALAAGYRDNGEPGERPRYHPGYFGAFVFDADGHNVEAVFHDRSR
ncbi:MAG TPA: VOC family protein [Gaiellaceae bacterium]|nr:VOC family protein [Gaiellaceae bacterium]